MWGHSWGLFVCGVGDLKKKKKVVDEGDSLLLAVVGFLHTYVLLSQ